MKLKEMHEFCMIEAIAWLGCRLFVDMVSQLDLEDKVSHYPISDD